MIGVLLLAAVFEKIALVDSLDFCTRFDVETKSGTVGVIDHVQRSHPTALWWRDKGGGLMRYPSAAEGTVMSESPFDKRRVPCEAVTGWLRMDRGVEVFPIVREECAARKLGFGIHTTWEETHRSGWLLSNWTLAHPQYWGCRPAGKPWMGCCALSNIEVQDHKQQLMNERYALGGDTVFLDLWRRGEWSPAREYSQRSIDDWKRAYGCEPPKDPSDARWLKHVSGYVHDYLRRVGRNCHAKGIRFVIGLPIIDCADTDVWRLYALDWKRLAQEGTFDGVAIHYVRTDWSAPWDSTRKIYEYVMANSGRADVYFPVSAYNHEHTGIPAYCQKTKLTDGEVTRRLYDLAWDCGAAGVILDCVDYGNYTDAMNAALKETRQRKTVSPDTAGVRAAFRPYVERGEMPGYVSVLIDGDREEIVADGWSDVEGRVPMTPDTLFRVCSQTKGVVGAVAAKLVADGKLSLDDPVSKYLPEYRTLTRAVADKANVATLGPVKPVMTVRHVLSHTAGFPFETAVSKAIGWTSTPPRVAAAVAATEPLLSEPGQQFRYSNAGIDVAVAVIEKVTGEPIGATLKRSIFDPLKMRDTTFRPNAEQLSRLAKIYVVTTNGACVAYGPHPSLPEPYDSDARFPSGGAGLFSTPRDMAEFYRMLAFGGVNREGRRVLPEEAVAEILCVKQTPPNVKVSYSLGLFVDGDTVWHDGALKTTGYANPKKRQVRLWMMQGTYRPYDINRWHQKNVWEPVADAFFASKVGAVGEGLTP